MNIKEVFKNFDKSLDDYLGALYINIFGVIPICYRIFYDISDEPKLIYNKTIDSFENYRLKNKHKIDIRQTLLKMQKNSDFIIFCYSSNEYLVLYEDINKCSFLINFTVSESNNLTQLYEEIYTNNIDIAFNIIKDYFCVSKEREDIEFGIAVVDSLGAVYTTWYTYDQINIDVTKNYNDDIPYDKMCNIIEDDKSALMLFYGSPGTGKSSLIKHFISKYPNKDFIFMDGELLVNASKDKLMSYFLECQDTIFILEDCEKALVNREHNFNPVMSILLNITNGIIGDVLNIKLICTFNTSLKNIDPALLRKGRLSLKYEFNKLSKEKCRNLLNDDTINEDMTLAELYNKDEENDFSKQNTRKIGF